MAWQPQRLSQRTQTSRQPTVRRRKANSAAALRWWCASCQFKARLTLPDKMLDPAEWLPIFPLSPRGKWSPASPPWLAVVRPRHQRPRGATKLVSSGMVKSNHSKSTQGHAVFPCRLQAKIVSKPLTHRTTEHSLSTRRAGTVCVLHQPPLTGPCCGIWLTNRLKHMTWRRRVL
jgi:hypothetical protein